MTTKKGKSGKAKKSGGQEEQEQSAVEVTPVEVNQKRTPFYRGVVVTLSEHEAANRGQELAETVRALADREEMVKDRIRGLRDSLKPFRTDIEELSEVVATRSERRQVRCLRVLDFERRVAFAIREDTGEVIEPERPLTEAEMPKPVQDEIPGTTPEALRLLPAGDGKSAGAGEGAEQVAVESAPAPALGTLGDVWPGDEEAKPPATEQDVFGWLVNQAVGVLRETRRASLSTLQRRLRIAFEAAAKVMDELEARGIVGPATADGGPREILNLPEAPAGDAATGTEG